MGTHFSHYKNPPGIAPGQYETPTFERDFGFSEPRPERVMIATEAEMISAKVPMKDRDYCAHFYINFLACRKRVFPFLYQCGHEKHQYMTCEYEDFVLRMKEYERERRLRLREQRLVEAY